MGVRAVCTKTCSGRAANDRAVGGTSVLVLTSRDVWAPTRELAFGRYPLRCGWTLVRELRRWYWAGSYPKVRRTETGGAERPAQSRTGTPSVGRDGSLEMWPMRKCQADEVLQGVKVTEGETTENGTAASRPSGPADERPSLSVSVVCHGRWAERSRSERSRKHEPPRVKRQGTSSTQENVATERS